MSKKPNGRPTIHSKELEYKICEHVANGKSLRTVCAMDDMPAMTTIFRWLDEKPSFREQYARAKESMADALTEDMLVIPDEEEDVARARLKVDTRKWIASKLKAKKYGDSTQIKHADADGNKLEGIDVSIIPGADTDT